MFALRRRSVLTALALAVAASAQDDNRTRGAVPANPPLVRWQRTLADAEATRQASGQPLLICVNMDSEAASERLAHGRYTTAAFAELAQGFVAVIASPDRHAPKDYDEQGKRVHCPRFGCVTCGEHIAIEPELFAKFFKENRVAPRHMGVGSDGNELFDIFLTNDFALIDAALKEHGKPWSGAASPFDSRAREQEEAKYEGADRAGRAALLEAAARAAHRPYDLVRLGLRDADAGLRGLARQALAATATPTAQSLLIALLDDEPDRDARAALVPVLRKVADGKPETALALRVHEAMVRPAKVLDSGKWLAALRDAKPEPTLPDEDLDARLDELGTKAAASDASAAVIVEFGATTLRFARERIAAGKDAQFLLSDAEQAADKALAKDGQNVQAHALRAELAQMLGQRDVAAEHARASLKALLAASEVATTQAAFVLAGLAEGGAQAIYAAEGKKAAWNGELLSEADAAYSVLATHPAGNAAQAGAHSDLLAFLGLHGCARQALTRALHRFNTDNALHERFRKHVIATRGVEALTRAYAELGVDASDVASHQWFAGYAEFVLAEHHKRQGDNAPASAAYGRAVEAFLLSQRDNPAYAESASWYAAMAQAGRARVSLDLGDLAAAGKQIVEGIKRLPAVAEQEDGLGRTPLFTLKQILEQCAAKEMVDVRGEIERELSAVVPEVWAKATGG